MNEEWLDIVMGIMLEIITTVYSNESRKDKEHNSK